MPLNREAERRRPAHRVLEELRREIHAELGPAALPVDFLLAGVHRSLQAVLPVYAAGEVSAALRRFSVRPAATLPGVHELLNKLEDVLLRLLPEGGRGA
jgi:hypothetical protein